MPTLLLIAACAAVLGAVVAWLALRARFVAERAAASAEEARLVAACEAERTRGQERLDAAATAAAQRLADLRAEQLRMADQFARLSRDALQENSAEFLELAAQRLATQQEQATGELARREQAVSHLVAPLTESLQRLQSEVGALEKSRAQAYGELTAQLQSIGTVSQELRAETAGLVAALRKPHVRGQWGEMQLRRTVEVAGMLDQCDFAEQASVTTVDGRFRPDMVVRLPGAKAVVVDSKVPLSGWLDATEAADETARQAALATHARHVRTHLTQLADKRYWEHVSPTPELVVMFVPSDSFLDAALRHDAALLEDAFGRSVVIATPSTLMALLRTVAYTWKQDNLERNTQEILRLGRELHTRLSTMGGHVTALGTALGRAVQTYDKTVGCLESRVLVTARTMAERSGETPLEAPARLGVTPRLPSAPELVAADSGGLVLIENAQQRAV